MCLRDEQAALPGMTVGNKIVIHGTLLQVNEAMRGVFYYAPNNTNGNITFTVSVQDEPAPCMAPLSPIDQPSSEFQPAALSSQPSVAMARNVSKLLCDFNQSHLVTRYIPIFVSAINQPPQITIAQSAFTANINQLTPFPNMMVTDVDHAEAPIIYSAYGEPTQAPVTVRLSAVIGRLSLVNKDVSTC